MIVDDSLDDMEQQPEEGEVKEQESLVNVNEISVQTDHVEESQLIVEPEAKQDEQVQVEQPPSEEAAPEVAEEQTVVMTKTPLRPCAVEMPQEQPFELVEVCYQRRTPARTPKPVVDDVDSETPKRRTPRTPAAKSTAKKHLETPKIVEEEMVDDYLPL